MSETFEGLFVKFGGDTVEFDNSVKGINKALRNLKKDVSTFNKQLKFDPQNTEMLTKKMANFQEQVRVGTLKIKELRKQQQALGEDQIGTAAWQALESEIHQTEAQMQVVKRSIQATQRALDDLEPDSMVSLDRALEEVTKDLAIVNRKLALDPKNVDLIEERARLMGKQLEIAGQKTDKLGRELADLKTNNGSAAEIRTLERALSESEVQAKELERAMEDVAEETKRAEKAGKGFKDSFLFGAGAAIGAKGLDIVTDGISDLSREALDASDSLEKFESTMDFAGFNPTQIKVARQAVKKYADDTVYDMDTIANTTAQLAANGVKDYVGLTQAAGNLNAVAGGNAETFKGVAMALTQTVGAGKLTTENWNQIADAIPGASGKLQEAMKKNKAFTGKFRDAMEKGEITADEFQKALVQLGMQDVAAEAAKSTKTFEGSFGNLQATVVSGMQSIIDAIGKAQLTGAINQVAHGMSVMFKGIVATISFVQKNQNFLQPLITSILIATAVFLAFKASMGVSTGILAISKAIGTLVTANPILLMLSVLVGVLASLYIHNEAFRNTVIALAKTLMGALGSAVAFVQKLFAAFAPTIDQLIQKGGILLSVVLVQLARWFGKLGALVERTLAPFGGLSGILDKLGGKFGKLGAVLGITASVFTKVGLSILGITGPFGIVISILVAFTTAWMKTGDMSAGGITKVFDSLSQTIQKMTGMLTSVLPQIITVGSQLLVNLLQGITRAIPSITAGLVQVIHLITQTLTTLLPQLIEVGISIITTLLGGIAQALPMLIQAFSQALPIVLQGALLIITGLVGAMVQLLPMIIRLGIQVLMALINGIIQILPQLIQAALLLITTLTTALIKNLPAIIAAGIDLLMALINGIMKILPQLIQAALQIIIALVTALIKNLPKLIKAGVQLIMALVKGLIQVLPTLVKAAIQLLGALLSAILKYMPKLLRMGIDLMVSFIKGIWNNRGKIVSTISNMMTSMISAIGRFVGKMGSKGLELVGKLVSSIASGAGKVGSAALNIGKKIVSSVASGAKNLFSKGKEMAQDLINGLLGSLGNLRSLIKKKISGAVKGLGGSIKNLIGKGFDGTSFGLGGAVQSLLKVKNLGGDMPVITGSGDTNTTYNIHVTANNKSAEDIAHVVEKAIVRRFNK